MRGTPIGDMIFVCLARSSPWMSRRPRWLSPSR